MSVCGDSVLCSSSVKLLGHPLVSGGPYTVGEIIHPKKDRMREETHMVPGSSIEVMWTRILKHSLEMTDRVPLALGKDTPKNGQNKIL